MSAIHLAPAPGTKRGSCSRKAARFRLKEAPFNQGDVAERMTGNNPDFRELSI